MKRTTLLFVCLASACAASIAQSSDPSQIPSHKSRIRSLPGRIAAPVDRAKLKAGGQIKQYAKPSAATVLTHDEQGRVTQVLEPDAQGQPTIETDIAYDANGKILSIVQHGAQGDSARIRSFTYDAQSRVTSATSPEAGTIAYNYDASGNIASRTDARGITTSYLWDAKGRVLSKSYSDGAPTATFVYDDANFTVTSYLAGANGPTLQRIYRYDAKGHLIQLTEGPPSTAGTAPYSIALQYDTAGRLTGIVYPDGTPISQAWDGKGRLDSISSPQTRYFSGPLYASTGQWTSATFGDAFAVQQTFDKLHRLKEMKAISQGSPILDKSFRYTRSGDIAELHDALDRSASFAYKYDALDRVTSAAQVEGAFKEDFRYDAFGNRATSQLVPEAQAFNAQNRFAPSTNLTYGPSGEMTFDGHHRYAYTAEGYIGSVDDGAVKFVFDAEGNRIEKIVGEFVTDYVWLDGQLLAEKKPDGTWIDYIYAKGDRIAATTTAPSSSDGSYVAQGTTYFLADRLGLARVAVSGQGQLVSQGDFAPFGTELRDRTAESAGNLHSAASISFTGEVHDEETGLDTYKFRSYNAELGRWMSPDPSSLHYATLANPQGFNLYSYVTNDPLKYIDVDGLMEYDCDEDDDCSDCSDCGDCSDCYSDDGGGGGDGGGDSGNNGDEGDPSGPEATFYLTVYAGYISVSADPDPALDPTPLFLYTYVPPVDPSDGDVPVHGLWTYGNWCGAGGSGTPINATDAACMQHDVCYGSFTFGANYLGTNATLQGCNQILCNAARGRATALIGQAQANAAAIGYNTSRGFSPGQFLTPDQYNELVADSDINLLFTSLVLPGNSCQ